MHQGSTLELLEDGWISLENRHAWFLFRTKIEKIWTKIYQYIYIYIIVFILMISRGLPVGSISSFRILRNSSLREVDDAGVKSEGRQPTKIDKTKHYTESHAIKRRGYVTFTLIWFGKCRSIHHVTFWLCHFLRPRSTSPQTQLQPLPHCWCHNVLCRMLV